MSVFKSIGRAHAAAQLATAKAIGVQVEFLHRAEPCVLLFCTLGDEEIAVVEENGIQTETRTRTFTIPSQDGFSFENNIQEPVLPGDRIAHDNRSYYALEGGILKAGNDSIYVIRCINRKRLASGIN